MIGDTSSCASSHVARTNLPSHKSRTQQRHQHRSSQRCFDGHRCGIEQEPHTWKEQRARAMTRRANSLKRLAAGRRSRRHEVVLDDAVRRHRLGNLDESANVGALDVVDDIAVGAVFDALLVDLLHDAMQTLFDFVAIPRDANRVLRLLETRYRNATSVRPTTSRCCSTPQGPPPIRRA